MQNFVLVGKAILIEDKANCLEACRFDDKCLSCTYSVYHLIEADVDGSVLSS